MQIIQSLNRIIESIWLKLFFKLRRSIAIHEPGEYSEGKYKLENDINVNSGNGLKFTGNVVLDLNGKTISNTSGKNEWNYGIISEGKIKVYAKETASIIGFRAGIKTSGEKSSIKNIKFFKNRYIGIMIEADECRIDYCIIDSIGGVDDEPYAIGIQVGSSAATKINHTSIKNVYKQLQYTGEGAGEGLGINLSANSISCQVENSLIVNDEAKSGTIGIFCGIRGSHAIRKNIVTNFCCGVGAVSDATSTIEKNSIKIDKKIPDSYGICAEISKLANNLVSENFETRVLCKNHQKQK